MILRISRPGYADDIIVVPNFGPVLKGKEAVRESYLKQEKEAIKIHSFHAQTDKIWEDKIYIYEYGSYGLSFTSNSAKHRSNRFLFYDLEETKNKSYLIKYFISNLDFNPCKDYL